MHTRLAVVAFAPESLIEDMRKLRGWCPPSGEPLADCHVPLLRSLPASSDPSAVIQALESATADLPAFSVRAVEPRAVDVDGHKDVVFPLEASEGMRRLRARVSSAVGVEDQDEPNLPVASRLSAADAEKALRTIAGWRPTYAWVIRDVDVIGLYGGAIWRPISRLNFGRPQPIAVSDG